MSGRRPLILLAWLIIGALVVLGMFWVIQRRLIYLPSGAVPAAPAGVEEVSFETEDGLRLEAWHLETRDRRGTVIVFNGNAGNRSHRLPLGLALVEEGYSVLLTDYRGYGDNPGSPSEDGLAGDARAALDYVESTSPGPLVYFGESLGAGVAIGLAIDHPPAAMVLRSPFSSLADVAGVHYPWLPAPILLRDRFSNQERIGEVRAPLLVIAGSTDRIVPVDQSQAVYEAANEPKDLVMVDGAGHNDPDLLDGPRMLDAIASFLADALPPIDGSP